MEDKSGQVAHRIFGILEAFTDEEPERSALELSKLLAIPRSTVHRLLAMLIQEGYIIQNADTSKYRLGLKLVRLAQRVMNQLKIEPIATTFMRELAARRNCHVFLGVLDDAEGVVVYLAAISPTMPLAIANIRGRIHGTALGKTLAAYLPEPLFERLMAMQCLEALTPRTITDPAQFKSHLAEVRKQGYAVDREESMIGLHCVAVPIQDYSGHVIAALSVSAPMSLFPATQFDETSAQVSDCGNKISRHLGCPEELLIQYQAAEPTVLVGCSEGRYNE